MKRIIIILICLICFECYSQRSTTKRSAVNISIDNFIGTWVLKKYADIHLNYKSDSVKPETLRFTKDSVFISFENRKYAGTWKLVGSQPIIVIKETKQFNYTWISGDIDSKFFTTNGLGYYKYFERISKQ